MEEQLKRIEEKLDLVISVMAVNPEFENFVKEGKLKLHLNKFKESLVTTESKRRSFKTSILLETLDRYSKPHYAMTTNGTKPVPAFHCDANAPDYAREVILKAAERASKVDWDLDKLKGQFWEDIIYVEGFCPLMKEHLDRLCGKGVDIELELEKEHLRYLEENK